MHILRLPLELQLQIVSYLPPLDQYFYMRTCHRLWQWFQPTIHTCKMRHLYERLEGSPWLILEALLDDPEAKDWVLSLRFPAPDTREPFSPSETTRKKCSEYIRQHRGSNEPRPGREVLIKTHIPTMLPNLRELDYPVGVMDRLVLEIQRNPRFSCQNLTHIHIHSGFGLLTPRPLQVLSSLPCLEALHASQFKLTSFRRKEQRPNKVKELGLFKCGVLDSMAVNLEDVWRSIFEDFRYLETFHLRETYRFKEESREREHVLSQGLLEALLRCAGHSLISLHIADDYVQRISSPEVLKSFTKLQNVTCNWSTLAAVTTSTDQNQAPFLRFPPSLRSLQVTHCPPADHSLAHAIEDLTSDLYPNMMCIEFQRKAVAWDEISQFKLRTHIKRSSVRLEFHATQKTRKAR